MQKKWFGTQINNLQDDRIEVPRRHQLQVPTWLPVHFNLQRRIFRLKDAKKFLYIIVARRFERIRIFREKKEAQVAIWYNSEDSNFSGRLGGG